MDPEILRRQQQAAREAGLDALISLSPENIAYTTGSPVPSQSLMRWRHAICVIPASGEPAMVVVDMEETTVRAALGLSRLRSYSEFTEDPMLTLARLLKEVGLDDSAVGIELDYLSAKDHSTLRREAPRIRWAAGEGILARLRQIKTPHEIALLRRLSRITDQAIRDALTGIRAGMTEMDLAGAVTRNILVAGADAYKLLIVATGERSQYPNVGPTARVLRPGDLIRLEIFGLIAGYHAGVCRTAIVGQATAEQERIWANLMECKRLVLDRIRPEADTGEIYRDFLEKFSALGYAPIGFVGHGIGVHLHEEPYLGRYQTGRLAPGMVLGVEPLVYIPGRFGLQNKDMVLVTEGGAELLSDRTDTERLFPVP